MGRRECAAEAGVRFAGRPWRVARGTCRLWGLSALVLGLGSAIAHAGSQPQPSAGCANPVDPRLDPAYDDIQGIDLELSMPDGAPGAALRNYRVHVPRPSDYDPMQLHGLIFSSHGCGGSHQNSFRNVANELATHYDLPTITIGTDAASTCFSLSPTGADFAYFAALKARVLADYCVDESNVFFLGRSSGSFASQYFGCHNEATALVGDLGGISTGSGPPAAEACGPLPVLLGSALQDTTVPWGVYGEPARDWWIQNNGCSTQSEPAPDAQAQVCARHPEIGGCACLRYTGCSADFVQCTWNGTHTSGSPFDQVNMGWWLGEHANAAGGVILPDEIFASGFEGG